MAKSTTSVAKFTLTLKSRRYQGKEYFEFVGGPKHSGSGRALLVSLSCDSSGHIKVYQGEKSGKGFIYARAIVYEASQSKSAGFKL